MKDITMRCMEHKDASKDFTKSECRRHAWPMETAVCRSRTAIETCCMRVAQMTVIETCRMEVVQCSRTRDVGRAACRNF